jgi:hypothetical protein
MSVVGVMVHRAHLHFHLDEDYRMKRTVLSFSLRNLSERMHEQKGCRTSDLRVNIASTYPLFNVKFDSESRQDPSSEFESVKTKLVL